VVSVLRPVIKACLYWAGAGIAPVLMRTLPGPRLLILTYHRVLPEDHPARDYEEQGMVVSPQRLEMHLRLLARYVSYMHIDQWLSLRDAGAALPRLACAVTFDDGWADNYEHAYPVLQRLQVPASIYLATARIGSARGFWPTRLSRRIFMAWNTADRVFISAIAQQLPAVRWPAAVVASQQRMAAHELINTLKQHYVDEQIDAALDQVLSCEGVRPDPDVLGWQQVQAMTASGLINFGSHTRDHRRLVAHLPATVMQQEIGGSLQDLKDHLPGWRGGFCYPNGDSSAAALRQVRQHYTHSVFTDFGINRRTVDAHRLHRISLHDRSGAGPTAVLGRIAGAYLGLGA
jgi:hypothetical protein